MGLLNRERLLAKEALEVVKVELDKGDYVYVRQMTGRERDRFEQTLIRENKDAEGGFERTLEDFRAKLAASTMCDKEGNLMLALSDASLLSQNMSARRLAAIVEVAQELNQITEKDKEDLVKNSGGDPVANLPSDSVEN